jgi:hypothetical protein
MNRLLHFFAANTQVDPNTIGVPKVDLTNETLGNVVSAVFVVIGSLAVLFVLVGAARYVTANGEPNKVTQAKNTILYAAVGVVVSALGFTIVQFVIGRLTGTQV